jgi:hypothetical protein
MSTTFIDKCEILGELWMDYREDEEFTDLGLPLAYMISAGMVGAVPSKGAEIVEETFDLFLGAMNLKDTGFETLNDVFDRASDTPQ